MFISIIFNEKHPIRQHLQRPLTNRHFLLDHIASRVSNVELQSKDGRCAIISSIKRDKLEDSTIITSGANEFCMTSLLLLARDTLSPVWLMAKALISEI